MVAVNDRVRVLTASPDGTNYRLVVAADEVVTVESLEAGGRWAWCRSGSGVSGYIATSNLTAQDWPSGQLLPTIADRTEDCRPLKFIQEAKRDPTAGGTPTSARDGDALAGMYDNLDVYYKLICDCSDPTNTNVSFKRGEIVYKVLLDYDDPDGLVGVRSTLREVEGRVSISNVKLAAPLETQKWYFGKLSREEADWYLKRPGVPDSSFLVRESDNLSHYVISIKNKKLDGSFEIRHRKIDQAAGNKYYAWPGLEYSSVEDLIEGHRAQRGEAQLGDPCPKKPQQNHPEITRKRSTLGLFTDNKEFIREAGPWYINPDKISVTKEIGSGNFGVVKMALFKDTNMTVAVKTVKPGSVEEMMECLNEAKTMKSLRHPCLVKLHGITQHAGQICLIMEMYNNGSLWSYCRKCPGALSGDQRLNIARQVAAGMAYLADSNYVHCDLAARNVLLGDRLTAHVADFGLARMIKAQDEGVVVSGKKPWKWTAPELLTADTESLQWSTKCDVWSYGVLCWELYSDCERPYEGASYCVNPPRLLQFLELGSRLPKPSLCSQEFYDRVMLACWVMQPGGRPDFHVVEAILKTVYP